MRKSFLAKYTKRIPKAWTLAFILCFLVLTIAIPINSTYAVNSNSAGSIYLNHPDENGSQEGFLPNLYNGMTKSLTGYPEGYVVTGQGEVQYAYKGGVTTALADFGDSLYETPTGSAIIWAQDQYNQAIGKGSFTAFAYNTNDTDQFYVSGWAALSPIIGLWNWSKNLVYVLFIIILIAVAFMILFRQSLGGQQYVTLTNSLPSIVLSLILITFSYPISAVFIDFVSIGCNLVYNVVIASSTAPGYGLTDPSLKTPKAVEVNITTTEIINGTPVPKSKAGWDWIFTGNSPELTPLKNTLQPDDPQMSLWAIFYTSNAKVCAGLPITNLDLLQLTPTAGTEKCTFAEYLAPAALGGKFSGLINALVTSVDKLGVSNVLVEFGLILLIVSTQFKLLKRLLTDYLTLSFFPIISPWVFLLAALPNRTNKTIGDFLRILGGSAFNLVIIYACFLILIVLGYSTSGGTELAGGGTFQLGDSFKQASEVRWLPPMVGYSYGQIIGNEGVATANQKIITTVVIVLLFTAIPRIPDEIQAWLQVPELPAVLKGAGQEVTEKTKQGAGMIVGGIGGMVKQRFSGNK